MTVSKTYVRPVLDKIGPVRRKLRLTRPAGPTKKIMALQCSPQRALLRVGPVDVISFSRHALNLLTRYYL